MSTDKTLADVQPGGRVRLGDRATQEMVDAGAAALLAYRKSGGDYTVHPTHAAEAAINAALSVRHCCDGERCAGHSALSAQPSPGGQDALALIARQLRAAGASLPAPAMTGTIEGSVVTGLSIALALVEDAIAAKDGQR